MRYIFSMIAVFVIGLSILTACNNNAAPPVKIESAKNNTTNTAKPAEHTDEHAEEAPRITLADAKKDFDAGNAVFVDTRAESQFKQEHIKGAINIPAESAATRYKEIPTGKKIIAYCS
jgi:3-mercaptopyruvate sulfurtransferase SseA